GVAIANTVSRLPRGLETIDRTQSDVFARIRQLVDTNQAEIIVVGLPRDMKGAETAQTAAVRQFTQDLGRAVDQPIEFTDEAVTSLTAEDRLKTTGKPFDKADIDMQSAVIILEDWLANI